MSELEETGLEKKDQTPGEGGKEGHDDNVDYDSLSPEELEKLDASQFEEEADPEKDEIEKEKEDQDTDNSETKDKQTEEAGSDDESVIEKRFKDTRTALNNISSEKKKLERKVSELEQTIKDLKFSGFEILSDEEEKELKDDDPELFDEYTEKKKEFQSRQQEKRQIEQDIEVNDKQEIVNEQISQLNSFLTDIGVVDSSKSEEENQKAMKSFTETDEFAEFDNFLSNNFKPNKNGVFSKQTIRAAYRLFNFDGELEKAQQNAARTAREQVLNEIGKAANGGSALDRTKSSQNSKAKPVTELQQDDIDAMSPEQLEQAEKEYQELL